MGKTINELWHGNIVPQEDSRTNSKAMKELMGYIARHSEDLGKLLNEEQQEIFEKYQECWNEYRGYPPQNGRIRKTRRLGI